MALSLSLAGCWETTAPKQEVTVFLAASLSNVVEDLAREFEKDSGFEVTLHAGASGALRKQIELGAPADLFISADALQVDTLVASGHVRSDSRRVLAANRLVIAVPVSASADSGLPASLMNERYRRIAVAAPESAPAGRFAKQALEEDDLWQKLQDKLVFADDVRGAAHYVEFGTVDAAVIYQTDAAASSKLRLDYTFPSGAHEPCTYVGAVVARRGEAVASAFLSFMLLPKSQAIWRKHGFELPRTDTERRP